MDELTTLRALLAYGDEMNDKILHAAAPLSDSTLDQPFDMGMGTLRKTLQHIYIAEFVWLERWKGHAETAWPASDSRESPADLMPKFEALRRDRSAFLSVQNATRLTTKQVYRDSKGSKFEACLHEMLMQGIVHSIHHRAQAVNMIRRVGGPIVEVDFMYSRRRPAAG